RVIAPLVGCSVVLFSAAAVTTLRDAFRCRPLQGVALLCWRLERSPRGTVGSRRFHPLRKSAYRTEWGTLVTMRAPSARPLPLPKYSSAVATTLPTAPPALALLYSDVVWRQSMPVTTVVGNLDGGILAASVSARERNDSRAISLNQAPATTLFV